MTIPDFGCRTEEFGGVKVSCRYVVPGLTLHDLVKIYNKGFKDPENNELAGNPSKWPVVRGVSDLTTAILKAVYEEKE